MEEREKSGFTQGKHLKNKTAPAVPEDLCLVLCRVLEDIKEQLARIWNWEPFDNRRVTN